MSPSSEPHERPIKFALFGASLDTGNMGVSALAASVIGLVLRHRPGAEIKLFIGNRSSTPQQYSKGENPRRVQIINFRWSPKSRFHEHIAVIFLLACLWRLVPFRPVRECILRNNQWLREIAESDLAGDICGGDSFSDIYGVRRFTFGTVPVLAAIMMKTPLCLLPQTYGPFKHPVSKQIASWIMSHATAIMSRDEESIELVKFLTRGRSKKPLILFCPDVAFTLAPMAVEYPQIDPSLPDTQDMTLIGFNINGLMYNGGYTQDNMFGLNIDYRQFARRLTLNLLEKTTSHILLVPHTFGSPGNINSDPDACRNILEQLPINYRGRVHMVTEKYDQAELKFIIGKCDLFIGSRMHACIAALSQSIPTFGIAYSKKFLGVFRSIGAGDWVLDGRTLDADAITGSLVKAAQNISKLKSHFKVDLASVQNKINDRFREILG